MIWKTLRHPSILPLLGVAAGDYQFAMISEWMANGNINEFVGTREDANRFELVGTRPLLLAAPGVDNTFC